MVVVVDSASDSLVVVAMVVEVVGDVVEVVVVGATVVVGAAVVVGATVVVVSSAASVGSTEQLAAIRLAPTNESCAALASAFERRDPMSDYRPHRKFLDRGGRASSPLGSCVWRTPGP